MEEIEEDPKNLSETPPFLLDNTDQNKKKSGLTTIILLIIVLIILGAGVFFGWRYFTQGTKQQPVDVNPAPTFTPAPTRSLNRADWSFEVQNGSGVSGAAKKASDKLISLGYVVIKAGNADKDTYTASELFVRVGKESEADLLLADLKTNFNIASISGTLTEGTASARLIIGKE